MSCYLHHIKNLLDEAGITVTKENRKQVDQAIHDAVGVAYKDCPVTWKKIKDEIRDDDEKRRVFIEQLRVAVR